MTLTEQDRGRTVELTLGSVVTVRLKENPTTGYRWTLETVHGLAVIDDRFEGGGAIGAAGIRVLQFRAASLGTCDLRLKNWCAWEGETSVIDRFDLKVTVK